jgi:AbrB family looped-hinge helix DNA binding protein
MQRVTVSPKYQIVIPKEIRDALKIRPGQKLSMVAEERSIRLLPQRSIKEMEGFLAHVPNLPGFERDPDREFD